MDHEKWSEHELCEKVLLSEQITVAYSECCRIDLRSVIRLGIVTWLAQKIGWRVFKSRSGTVVIIFLVFLVLSGNYLEHVLDILVLYCLQYCLLAHVQVRPQNHSELITGQRKLWQVRADNTCNYRITPALWLQTAHAESAEEIINYPVWWRRKDTWYHLWLSSKSHLLS